jgi:hypothetical protein
MKTFGLYRLAGFTIPVYMHCLSTWMAGYLTTISFFVGKMWDERKDHSSKKHCDNYREAKLLYEKQALHITTQATKIYKHCLFATLSECIRTL